MFCLLPLGIIVGPCTGSPIEDGQGLTAAFQDVLRDHRIGVRMNSETGPCGREALCCSGKKPLCPMPFPAANMIPSEEM